MQQAEDFYELICKRYQRNSTIVVSNRAPQDWYGLFPNPVLAEGALDRLVNSAHLVLMTGKSYRPRTRPGAQIATATPASPEHPREEVENPS